MEKKEKWWKRKEIYMMKRKMKKLTMNVWPQQAKEKEKVKRMKFLMERNKKISSDILALPAVTWSEDCSVGCVVQVVPCRLDFQMFDNYELETNILVD